MGKLALLIFVGVLSSCQLKPTPTLYEQLGGQDAINSIVGRFIYLVESEPQVLKHFRQTDLNRFYDKFGEHMCEMADGPCVYTGDTLLQVHTGMNITETEFNLLVELLMNAMTQEHIPQQVQNQIIKRLVPLRSDVIYQ